MSQSDTDDKCLNECYRYWLFGKFCGICVDVHARGFATPKGHVFFMSSANPHSEDQSFTAAEDDRSLAELRALFRAENEVRRRQGARRGLWVAVSIYVLFLVPDLIIIPDVAQNTIVARILIGVIVLLVLELQSRLERTSAEIEITCASSIFLGYLFWLVPAVRTEHTLELSYYMIFGAIFMMGANLFFSLTFKMSLLTSGLVMIIFYLSMITFNPSNAYLMSFGLFYISCFVFTSYVNWSLNKERFNVFLNALDARYRQEIARQRGEALYKLSRTDHLTGLDNRRVIDEKIQEYWRNWQVSGVEFGVLLVDVDFFKRYNDAYGHQQGDRCLRIVAEALKATAAEIGASIARYGGEEFIVLVWTDSEEAISAFAEALRASVEDLNLKHDERRDGATIVTVSIGAALSRQQTGAKIEKIIHQADRALYLAKASGRNCSRLFDITDPHTSDVNENIAALLKIAISESLVSLAYQPIQNVQTGEVVGAEALMRLKMLDDTSVPPSLFIPIAERTGAILELGRFAIRTACRELAADRGVPIVSVNVSPVQLRTPGFAASVAVILHETGVTGNRLALEITEGLEMEMHSDVLRCIGELKNLGVKIWLDDFGTGFAGLSWLRLIEFDTVKIDRSFLHDCGGAKGRAMMRDIISLVRNRGPKILVEGVESEDQLVLMRKYGIDFVQGYHIGRPAPAEAYWSRTTDALIHGVA